jgi:hypothetical protein
MLAVLVGTRPNWCSFHPQATAIALDLGQPGTDTTCRAMTQARQASIELSPKAVIARSVQAFILQIQDPKVHYGAKLRYNIRFTAKSSAKARVSNISFA